MPDTWLDEDGNLFVDLGSDDRSHNSSKKRSSRTTINNVDLASGFPPDQIWTTKEGQRIPVPMMQDSHLLNVIAFLRRNVEHYKKQVAMGDLVQATAVGMMFENAPFHGDESFDEWYNSQIERAQKIWDMPTDKFLRGYHPIWKYLIQEAYKRKLLIEGTSQRVIGDPSKGNVRVETITLERGETVHDSHSNRSPTTILIRKDGE